MRIASHQYGQARCDPQLQDLTALEAEISIRRNVLYSHIDISRLLDIMK